MENSDSGRDTSSRRRGSSIDQGGTSFLLQRTMEPEVVILSSDSENDAISVISSQNRRQKRRRRDIASLDTDVIVVSEHSSTAPSRSSNDEVQFIEERNIPRIRPSMPSFTPRGGPPMIRSNLTTSLHHPPAHQAELLLRMQLPSRFGGMVRGVAARATPAEHTEPWFHAFNGGMDRPYIPRAQYPVHDDFDTSYEALIALGERIGTVKPTGVPKSVYEKFQVSRFKPSISNPEANNECSICISSFKKNENVMTLPCKHPYHKTCIVKWFKKGSHCPVYELLM